MDGGKEITSVRILCRKLIITKSEPGLQWLIGSPFFPPFTIVSTFRCIHTLPSTPLSPDYTQESDDFRALLLKGFEVIGALIVGNSYNFEQIATEAVDAASKLRKLISGNIDGRDSEDRDLVGGFADLSTGNVQFFVSRSGNSTRFEYINDVIYEDQPEKYIWERGCILRCELPIKLPIFCPVDSPNEAEDMYLRATDAIAARFRDPQVMYMMETFNEPSTEVPCPVIVRGLELDFHEDLRNASLSSETSEEDDAKTDADKIQVSVLLNKSERSPKSAAPIAEYLPALKEAKLLVVDHKLDVLCYSAKNLSLKQAVSKLIIPGLVDQLCAMKNTILPNLLRQLPLLHPYHFSPPGFLHPITVVYELSYGETEMKQVEARRSLHLRLGLPFDRPLLRVANSINLSLPKGSARSKSIGKGSPLLKDVHLGIPSSGVSGGFVSMVQGSYEYYHYLQDGFDDSGWGCAYRSLQTIISWFRLQHYTSIDVPSHREIQQSLVEVGDKEPLFIGSRDWIGAIELSFVLDKLLGVSCKVINVRSGAELPEKCRELALHFENQGTPIMIGGGVLAYTLLGVDYNEASGDCAFLILDPHYTGSDDLKKIVNGGWCGWKKAVDSKGKHFFLHDKFYNLLLPQRPNMV
ncbi:hypothetical protein U1Q18_027291 [Sarracenia purpurea var. burkii]